jgi:Protein of Unknown function (DUF2784)
VARYQIQADFVVALHAAYIAFVVFGLITIVIGVAMDWRWVRNMYFRAAHLAAILLVCIEALAGMACPLTVLEYRLRVLGGATAYPGSFVGHLLDRLIFYDLPQWLFTIVYLSFGALVLLLFMLAPPRIGRVRNRL